jgi:hypothetical protein
MLGRESKTAVRHVAGVIITSGRPSGSAPTLRDRCGDAPADANV